MQWVMFKLASFFESLENLTQLLADGILEFSAFTLFIY